MMRSTSFQAVFPNLLCASRRQLKTSFVAKGSSSYFIHIFPLGRGIQLRWTGSCRGGRSSLSFSGAVAARRPSCVFRLVRPAVATLLFMMLAYFGCVIAIARTPLVGGEHRLRIQHVYAVELKCSPETKPSARPDHGRGYVGDDMADILSLPIFPHYNYFDNQKKTACSLLHEAAFYQMCIAQCSPLLLPRSTPCWFDIQFFPPFSVATSGDGKTGEPIKVDCREVLISFSKQVQKAVSSLSVRNATPRGDRDGSLPPQCPLLPIYLPYTITFFGIPAFCIPWVSEVYRFSIESGMHSTPHQDIAHLRAHSTEPLSPNEEYICALHRSFVRNCWETSKTVNMQQIESVEPVALKAEHVSVYRALAVRMSHAVQQFMMQGGFYLSLWQQQQKQTSSPTLSNVCPYYITVKEADNTSQEASAPQPGSLLTTEASFVPSLHSSARGGNNKNETDGKDRKKPGVSYYGDQISVQMAYRQWLGPFRFFDHEHRVSRVANEKIPSALRTHDDTACGQKQFCTITDSIEFSVLGEPFLDFICGALIRRILINRADFFRGYSMTELC